MTGCLLLAKLREIGVEPYLTDTGELRAHGSRDALTDALRAALAQQKRELIALLRAGVSDWSTAGMGTLMETARAMGAALSRDGNRVRIDGADLLPEGLAEVLRSRERGVVLRLVFDERGEAALTELLIRERQPRNLVEEVETLFDEAAGELSPWR